jgi:gamma-glutamylcyclotransferase
MPLSPAPRLWYFAYGSNMQRGTFCGRRGIECSRAEPARAAGWRLVFDKPGLIPLGEAFANIVPDAGAEVLGVAYEIDADDLAHVELTEGVLIGNYRPLEIPVALLADPGVVLTACTLASDRRDPRLRPSDRYMACVIGGAEEHGLPATWVDFLRAVPVARETSAAAELRPFFDEALRRPKKT